MAKRFFYVCAGIVLLVLAHELGSTKANAQGPQLGFYVAILRGRAAMAIYPNGDVWYVDAGWHAGGNVFGGNAAGRTIVAADGGELNPIAVASTGEIFYGSNYTLGVWENLGAPPPGVTGAVNSSWGAIKVGSRP